MEPFISRKNRCGFYLGIATRSITWKWNVLAYNKKKKMSLYSCIPHSKNECLFFQECYIVRNKSLVTTRTTFSVRRSQSILFYFFRKLPKTLRATFEHTFRRVPVPELEYYFFKRYHSGNNVRKNFEFYRWKFMATRECWPFFPRCSRGKILWKVERWIFCRNNIMFKR